MYVKHVREGNHGVSKRLAGQLHAALQMLTLNYTSRWSVISLISPTHSNRFLDNQAPHYNHSDAIYSSIIFLTFCTALKLKSKPPSLTSKLICIFILPSCRPQYNVARIKAAHSQSMDSSSELTSLPSPYVVSWSLPDYGTLQTPDSATYLTVCRIL